MKYLVTTALTTFAVIATMNSGAIAGKMPPAEIMKKLKAFQDSDATINKNLKTFDTLDFDVCTNQKWDRLTDSHSKDILVHYPDGHTSKGLDAHIKEIAFKFVFAPNTRIKEHPVHFGSGEWTGVIGTFEGTFTKPLPTPDGKMIPPTEKAFKIGMSTIGHWTKAGVMDEEFIFLDNQAFMKQVGLGQ